MIEQRLHSFPCFSRSEALHLWFNTDQSSDRVLWQKQTQLWQYGLVVFLSSLIIVAREPERILTPRFYAEDGSIFFAQAFNLSTIEAVTTRYGGYYHLAPRLIAEIGSYIPFSAAPLFYSVSALLINSFAVSWFYLPHFRHVIRRDSVRLGCVLALLCSPNIESPMAVAYVQWYIALWAILAFFMILPQSRGGQVLLLIGYLVAIGTAPVLIILLPLWLLRLYFAQSWFQRAWISILILAQSAIPFVSNLPARSRLIVSNFNQLSLDLIRAFTYKVIMLNWFGENLAAFIMARLGWPIIYGISAGVIVLGFFALSGDLPKYKVIIILMLLYLLCAATALYGLRAIDYGFIFMSNVGSLPHMSARYFLIGSMALYLIVGIGADKIFTNGRSLVTLAYGVGYVALIVLYSLSFRLPSWENPEWPKYVALMTYLQAEKTATIAYPLKPLLTIERPVIERERLGGSPLANRIFLPIIAALNQPQLRAILAINIPITPFGWWMTLLVPKDSARVYSFPEGITLIGLDQHYQAHTLTVDLFWQGNPVAILGANTHYTAYVHLVDKNGTRLAGADVLLDEKPTESAHSTPFLSHHNIPLARDTAPGPYNLVIGLYHFDKDRLVNGNSAMVENAVLLR
ncbi:MAG: hypothetical protein U0350_30385 [Caldilineaceae bacterium]